jgi:hypothetical protein
MSVSGRPQERRRDPRAHPDATSIQPADFLRLLLSRRMLVRLDYHDGNVHGLQDLETGEKFLVKRMQLLRR